MTITSRIAAALSIAVLTAGFAATPAAYAMDSMKGDAMMHKHMKKHKAMKGDHMKGGDAMKPAETPAQ